jgi:hypothetical protein
MSLSVQVLLSISHIDKWSPRDPYCYPSSIFSAILVDIAAKEIPCTSTSLLFHIKATTPALVTVASYISPPMSNDVH